jgi:hypothetical protein
MATMHVAHAGLAALVLSLTTVAAPTQAAPPALQPAWTLDGFANPESLVPAPDASFFYVSNVAGEGDARDGNGFISRISPSGQMLQREWATGLHAPKGLALRDGTLYVSDIDALVEIDVGSGKVRARHAIAGARFLNDVAIAGDGAVLVSDSGSGRIHAWRDGAMTLWLEHPLLASVNGLLPDGGRLLVTTMAGRLLSVDVATKAVAVLAEGLGNGDGVAILDDGSYLVGEWPGQLFHVRADGSHAVLMDSRAEKVYLNDFLRLGDLLLIPNWEPSRVSAYRLQQE